MLLQLEKNYQLSKKKEEQLVKIKKFLAPKRFKLLTFAALLHFLGIFIALFWGGKNVAKDKFNLFFHLLRFFSWWSVHTSILTIWTAILIWKERKKSPSHFSQFIAFLATIYNLITFFFWVYCLFFLDVKWEKCLFLNIWSISWHLIAPLLTIFYFYLYVKVNWLNKRLAKTLSLAFLSPIFYFFYVYILAKINYGESSSLFPYMEKYPYRIFECLAERRWNIFIFNFFLACLVYLIISGLIIWTKNKLNKTNSN